jgi:hypothetical protein
MFLDPNDEDGVCGAAYQEWRAEQWAFEPDYNPDLYQIMMMSKITNGSVHNVEDHHG